MSGISCQGDCFQVAVVTQECSEGSGRVFDGIDFVFAVDGNPRWRHLGFLVSGRSRKPRRKGMGKGAAAPPFPCLFCSRTDRISVLTGQGRSSSCKIWEVGTQSPLTWTFQPSSILLPSGFRSLDGRALSLEKTGNLGLPVFCSQQSDYPISCHLQMAAAQFAISVLRIMERRELRDA